MKRILECSSAGDARFSAYYAQVEIDGVMQSIEEHYQLSKRFRMPDGKYIVPKRVDEAKGKHPMHFVAYGLPYQPEFLTAWYTYLWIQYLDDNPMLVGILSHYDDYSDQFKTSSTINCQADVIRDYMFLGRDALWNRYADFYEAIESHSKKNRRIRQRSV